MVWRLLLLFNQNLTVAYSKWHYASRWSATNELSDNDNTSQQAVAQEVVDFNSGGGVEIPFSSWGYIVCSSPTSWMEFELGTLSIAVVFLDNTGDPSTWLVLIRYHSSRLCLGADSVPARDADFQSVRAPLCLQAPGNGLFASFKAASFPFQVDF